MNRMIAIAALVTFAGLTAQAAAQAKTLERPLKPAASFGYLDIDKDERVSLAEAKADWAVMQRFQEADVDHDGFLDEREFEALTRWTMARY
jgi:hypothetical protein